MERGKAETTSESEASSSSTSASSSVVGDDHLDESKAEFVKTFETILDDMSKYDEWSVNIGGVRVSATEDYYELFIPAGGVDPSNLNEPEPSLQVYDSLMFTMRRGVLQMTKEEEVYRRKTGRGEGSGRGSRPNHVHNSSHNPLLYFAKDLKSRAQEKLKETCLKKLRNAHTLRMRNEQQATTYKTLHSMGKSRSFLSSSVSLFKHLSSGNGSSGSQNVRIATFRLLSNQQPMDIPQSVAPASTTTFVDLSFMPGILPTAALTDGAVAAQKGLVCFLAMLPLDDPQSDPDTWQLLVCNPLLRECSSVLKFSTAVPFISWQADIAVNTNQHYYDLFVSTVVLGDDGGVGPWTVQVYNSYERSWRSYEREGVLDPENERPSHAFFLHAGHDLLIFSIEQDDKQLMMYEIDSREKLRKKFEIQMPALAFAQNGHSAFLVEHHGSAILIALTQVAEDETHLTTFGIWKLGVETHGKQEADYCWEEISILPDDIRDYIDRRGVALDEVEELRYSINGAVIISDIICIEVDFWMSLTDRQEITRILLEYHITSAHWMVMRTKERTTEAPGWDLWGKLLRTVFEPRWDIHP